ncbi:Prephenate dehydrogenase [Desulfovibrio sp. X2]|uniref:prephenate dehydrogenase/arogenate dehydrogenase family protein n=1 Tax=Desulfovibrio sp. X2 TaxID=941449 RepID=UPI0003587327|nr:prephenate dehydrogenase/arogenate dehydrogenase family protein [Desulfovibrio sp. X2]EPR36309.1 Prephenate dehydrogenase [Desulfovibrio sp. X2]
MSDGTDGFRCGRDADVAKDAREINTIAVVGARGEMGRMLCERARAAGMAVRELDKPLTAEGAGSALPGADLVLVCVPIDAVGQALGIVAPLLDGEQILADVCSVKVTPLRQMLNAYAGPVVGTHPLFGGVLPEPEDRRVSVCPGRDDAARESVCTFLRRLGFIPFDVSAREHDNIQSFVQGLNFVTTVAYLATVAAQEGVLRFVTPSFRRRLEAARKMCLRDSSMFEAMFESNPASQEAVRIFRSHLNVAAGGDVDLLVERARWWWSDEARDREQHAKGADHATDQA